MPTINNATTTNSLRGGFSQTVIIERTEGVQSAINAELVLRAAANVERLAKLTKIGEEVSTDLRAGKGNGTQLRGQQLR